MLRNYITNGGSDLSLLPTLSEDLPVVAVAGILKAEESSIAEPGV